VIDPDSLRRIRALLETELRAAWRDRAGVVGGVLFLLFVGLTGPIGVRVGERLFPEPPDDESASSAWDCKPGELGPVAVAGELPPWFTWPEPLVPAEDAEILIRPGPPGVNAWMSWGSRRIPAISCASRSSRRHPRARRWTSRPSRP
jgi:hypothetical protein